MVGAQPPKPDMPTYEYSCITCGHSLEAYQSMKDAPLSACPACGRPALRRLSGRGCGTLFRGQGFFQGEVRPEVPAHPVNASASPPPGAA